MIKLSRILGVFALAALQGVAADAWAERWFFFSPLTGEVELGYTGAWNRNENPGSSDTQSTELTERLRLEQSGYILDPRIANFVIRIEPTFTQSAFSDDTGTRSTDKETLNYGINARAFHGTPGPFGFGASARRDTGTTHGGLGSQSEFDIENRTVSVNWKNRAFPTTLSYIETYTDQTFRSGLSTTTSQRDDAQRTLTLKGRSTKLNILLERVEFEDQINLGSADTTTDTARLNHSLRWGRGSNLSTGMSYTERTGGPSPVETRSINESLGIRHTENLSSSTSYSLQSTRQDTTETVRRRGDFRVRHQLYDSLTTTANVHSSTTETKGVTRENRHGGGLTLAYRKKIPWEGMFSAGLGGSYTLTDRETTNGLLPVVDEAHPVDATTTGFLLNQRFVDQPSVIVADSGTGIPYLLGADYLVVAVIGDLTDIQIVPGGAIAAAAVVTPITVLVSYDYQPLPSQELSSTNYSYNLGLNFDWIRVYHRQSISNQDRISGASASFLTDRRNTMTGLELNWTRGRDRATLTAERRLETVGVRETETYSIREALTYNLAPDKSLSAGASQVFTESDGTQTDLYTANLSMAWRPRYNLTVKPFLTVWTRRDEGAAVSGGKSEENFLSVGADADSRYGKITLNMRYNHDVSSGDSPDRTQDRVMLTLKRNF